MSFTISSSLATVNSNTSAVPASAAQTAVPAATKLQISQAQQAVQLYNQGQQVSQIASSLALPVETVNLYLGISSGG